MAAQRAAALGKPGGRAAKSAAQPAKISPNKVASVTQAVADRFDGVSLASELMAFSTIGVDGLPMRPFADGSAAR